MIDDIISKLSFALNKSIRSEPQIVYILTRIGKVLELENSKRNSALLNFYRNWSVHSEIDQTEPVADILSEFIKKRENRYRLSLHQQFCSEFTSFLDKHKLPHILKNRLNNFIFYLGKVISDTPIKVVIDEQKYSISIAEPTKKGWSGLYTISLIPNPPEGRESGARKK